MQLKLAAIVGVLVTISASTSGALFSGIIANSTPLNICEAVNGCAEAYAVDHAWTQSYSGPLFQFEKSNSTTDVLQDANHNAIDSWTAAGCTFGSTDGYGIKSSTNCFISKFYAEINGHSNDLAPSTIGSDCNAGGYICAIPLSIDTTTNLPIAQGLSLTQGYLNSGNDTAAAIGITGGTSSISQIYLGKPVSAATACCGATGIGHKAGDPDTHGTTFYLSISYGQFSDPSGNQCQTSTSYCWGADEESIGDWKDYSTSTLFSNVFAANTFNSAVGTGGTMSGWLNDPTVHSYSVQPPAAYSCGGCAGMNLPTYIHFFAGGDMSTPAGGMMRGTAFLNVALTQAQYTTAFSAVKAIYPGLTFQ